MTVRSRCYSGQLTIAGENDVIVDGNITRSGTGLPGLVANHSFIVDHYNCGASLGTLTVNGAISQKFRGAVGTTSGGGSVIQTLDFP